MARGLTMNDNVLIGPLVIEVNVVTMTNIIIGWVQVLDIEDWLFWLADCFDKGYPAHWPLPVVAVAA